MARIICDNHKCEFNHEEECTAAVMHYADRLCRTFRRIRAERVMQPDHRPRCRKSGGKYKSNGGRLWR